MSTESSVGKNIERMSWGRLGVEINALSEKINYQPDMIVGIVRGGIVPARLLATRLNVTAMYCLTVKKVGEERKVTSAVDKVNAPIVKPS